MPTGSLTVPGIDAGKLDRRITLLSPVYNAAQDEVDEWAPAATVWAAVSPVFAQEQSEGARQVEMILINVVIRYRADVDARWRVADREHVYQIRGLVDVTRRREQLQLRCEEIL